MKKSTIASLATFVVVMVLGVAYLTLSVVQYNPLRRYTTVNMVLDNSSQLVHGTSVLLRGVKVGDVVSVTPSGEQVAVKVRFNRDYQIPAETEVKIEQLSAVGEPILDFMPDSLDGPYLHNGSTIGTAQIRNPLSIPAIFKLVAGFSSNINSKQLGGIADTVYQATDGTQDALPNLSTAGQLLSQTILSRMPGIRQMLVNTQNYQSDWDWVSGALPGFTSGSTTFINKDAQLMQVMDTMMKQGNLPNQLTQTVNPYLGTLVPYTNKLLPNLGAIVGPLAPSFNAINDVLPQLDISAMLSQALNTFGSNGANLTVTIPQN